MRSDVKVIPLKRLYKGKIADIRSYELEELIKKKKSLCFTFRGKKMTITPDRFSEGVWGTTLIPSKIKKGQKYQLVSFDWKADKEMPLFEVSLSI